MIGSGITPFALAMRARYSAAPGGGGDTTAPQPAIAFTDTAAGTDTITLAWTGPVDADRTGYIVERSLDGATGWAAITGSPFAADSTGTTDTGLAASTAYYYRIAARDDVPNVSGYLTANAQTAADQAAGYTFFRLTILANNGDTNWTGVRELELREAVGGVNALASRTKTVTASATGGGAASQAFDSSYTDGNGWIVAATFPQWIQVEVDTPITVAEYALGGYPSTNLPLSRS